jgi:hypothetical protein
MNKTYQPFIIEKTKEIIDYIKSKGFFEDFQIKSDRYAQQLICDILTDKLIDGTYDEGDDIVDIFPEVDDLLKFFADVVTLQTLDSLIEKGYIETLEDENGENFYFATKKGQKYQDEINKQK